MKNIIKLSLDSFHLYFEQSNLDELLKMGGSKNEVKTSVCPPSAVRRPTMPFAVHSPPTDGPSHHKKLLFAGNYSYRIDPTVLASDVGRRNVRRSFLWSDGWADAGQKET